MSLFLKYYHNSIVFMGNDTHHYPTFQRQQWQIVEKNPNHTLWHSRNEKNLHIQQYDIFTRDQDELKQSKEVFEFRYRHPQLVSSLYYQQHNQQEFCAVSHQYGLFIQKIPIRLIDIEHIPYPDLLHLYSQALNGFYLIAQRYGCFEVEQQYIGINQKGVVKVWMNRDFSRSYIVGGRISEQHMVKGLVDIIDANCDLYKLEGRPTIRNYLYRNADMLRFAQALRQLQNYVRQYNQGYVPTKLDCIDRVGGIYVIVNRQSASEQSESAMSNHYFTKNPGQHLRPKLTSDVQLSEPKMMIVSPPQHNQQPQVRVGYQGYQPPAVNFGLKGSEAFPHPRRQQYIVPPEVAREDMEVVRRRRSQHQTQNVHYIDRRDLRPMKYSQNIEPVHHYISPAKAPSAAITFTLSPTKLNQPSQQINTRPVQIPLRNSYSQIPPPIRQSSQSNSCTVTFKMLSQNISDNQPRFDINLHNTSLANMSAGDTSRSNTNRLHHATPSGDRQSTFIEPIYEEKDYSAKKAPMKHNRSQSQGFQQFENETFKKKIDIKPEYRAQRQTYQDRYQESSRQYEPIIENNSNSYPESRNNIGQEPTRVNLSDGTFKGISYRERTQNSLKSFQNQLPYNTRTISFQQRINNQQSSNYQNYQLPSQKQTSDRYSNEPGFKTFSTSNKYQSVSVDDGKSSQQFLKQLKQIKSSMHQNIDEKNKNSAFTHTYTTETYDQRKSNNFYQVNQNNKYDPMTTNHPLITQTHFDAEDFGRNTVSNIIETDSPQVNKNNYLLARSNTPLMFEKNLEMKYSMLGEDPQPQAQSFREYDNHIDSDILADLRKMQA